jgi:glycosyltransferase involved in cell wall biosynthesis
VIFHGLTDNQKVIGFYKSNEINYFINVSLSEGLPVSIMEAMSFGIPTIATNVGGTGDLVTDDNGRIIDVDMSASDLANILMEEISLPENEYMKKRENARQSWEMNFSADNNYAEWCKNILNIKAILK